MENEILFKKQKPTHESSLVFTLDPLRVFIVWNCRGLFYQIKHTFISFYLHILRTQLSLIHI